jgi:putative NADH-flavin reductase
MADRGLVVVFGASGAIGRRIVDEALRAGYRVRAFTRDAARVPPRRGLEIVEGDAADAEAVARAIAGTAAVVNALGPTTNGRAEIERTVGAIRNILAGMESHRVRRLISLNGAAVTEPGERKPVGARIAGAIVRLFAGNVVRAKQREYEEIASSDVEWTIVRPPRVSDTPRVGRAVAGDRLYSRRVSEIDLAEFMVKELEAREYVRRAPYVSG